MEAVIVRIASAYDTALLAQLNKQLIEDEQHDNPMSVEQLAVRMNEFMNNGYAAYLFELEGAVIGYALVNQTRDPMYLRQFFICRHCRRKGYGKQAFYALLAQLGTNELDLEVLNWNEAGRLFWKSVGFVERSIYMKRQ